MKVEFRDAQWSQLKEIKNPDQQVAAAVYFLRNPEKKTWTWSEANRHSQEDLDWLKSKNITVEDLKDKLHRPSLTDMGRVALIGLGVLFGAGALVYVLRRNRASISTPAPAPVRTSVRPARHRR